MLAKLRVVSQITLANFGPVWTGAGAGTEGVAGTTGLVSGAT